MSQEVLAPQKVTEPTHRCVCGDELVKIDLLIDGEELTMHSCSRCDARSWHRKGERVQLGGVLTDLSATQTRYRRDLATR